MTDYWFPLSLLAATLGLALARVAGAPVSAWLVATPLALLLSVMLAAYAFIRVYAYRHRGDAGQPGLEASSHSRFTKVRQDLSAQRLEVMEPVRDANGRIDVEATVRQSRKALWRFRLLPGGRIVLAHHDRFLMSGLEQAKRREED